MVSSGSGLHRTVFSISLPVLLSIIIIILAGNQPSFAILQPCTNCSITGSGIGTITCSDGSVNQGSITFFASKQGTQMIGKVSVVTSSGGGLVGTGSITGGKIGNGIYTLTGNDSFGICGTSGSAPFTISGITGPSVPIAFSWVHSGGAKDAGSFAGTVTASKA